MDLFTPLVPAERQHRHFRTLLSAVGEAERQVLRDWAAGFKDRDGKFVTEFQATFNSSFWELYLNAAFSALDLTVDYRHASPDFVCAGHGVEFNAEAAVASHADGYAAEWDARLDDEITPERKQAMLEYASLRLANAFDGKLKKYRTHYARLPHVIGRPYVICLAPFEQPQSYALGDRAMRRVLYSYDMPVYVDDDERGSRTVFGETVTERIWKDSGAEVPFGVFTDKRAREVSAVIYSNVATFGKVQVLAAPSPDRHTFVSTVRYNDAGLKPHLIRGHSGEHPETLLDGLHVFLNPHADVALDPRLFAGREIAVHHGFDPALGGVPTEMPDLFLISRSTLTLVTRDNESERHETDLLDDRAPRARMPAIGLWPEGELKFVGGRSAMFTDNHLAHYRGWTILVARDEVDGDWGGMANKGIYRDLAAWMDGMRDEQVPSLQGLSFLPTRDEAFEAMKKLVEESGK